ncbi:outer dynein arm-docking complex subunit 4 [Aphomia sociella]
MRKKLVPEEKAICNAVAVYRERGNYLQRLEQFEKAILAYDEALRWNNADVRSLLGRSLARAKMTHYAGALVDAARAADLEPENLTALQIRAHTDYEKCAFERALVLASRGQCQRRFPPNFVECARQAEETIRECVGDSASKVLSSAAVSLLRRVELTKDSIDADTPTIPIRKSRMQPQPTQQVQEISRVERQKTIHISRLMASKYLERMAHDKYFLTSLSKDERLASANKKGTIKLKELVDKALANIEKRQAVLRVRCPMYAANALEAAARARLYKTRKEQFTRAQSQHVKDAKRLIRVAQLSYEERDTNKCLENAEFAMEQISRKPANLLPGKEKFLNELYDIVAGAFLDQKCVKRSMSESDREKRAFTLLGMLVSREPSRDSVLRVRPPAPPRDAKRRLRVLERGLTLSSRAPERCYMLHELARLHVDTKQAHRARFYASKCQAECRAANQRGWLLNATFLLARCHLLQNNRPEARAALIEGAALARSFGFSDVAAFFDTCVNVSLEGEVASTEAALEKREKAMVSLMQDDDLRSAAEHLFRKMSVIPAARRFSIMPGTRVEDSAPPNAANRRISIIPRAQQPTQILHKGQHPLGFQEFDI